MSPFFGYYLACKDYGHKADECKNFSRISNFVGKIFNAYVHKTSKCRNLHMLSPGYANKSPFIAPRKENVTCHHVMDLAIEVMSARRRCFMHMGANSYA